MTRDEIQAQVDADPNAEYFGHCPRCGKGGGTWLNVGRTHHILCEECNVRWIVGGNIFISWRFENEAIWKRNHERLEQAQEVEPVTQEAPETTA